MHIVVVAVVICIFSLCILCCSANVAQNENPEFEKYIGAGNNEWHEKTTHNHTILGLALALVRRRHHRCRLYCLSMCFEIYLLLSLKSYLKLKEHFCWRSGLFFCAFSVGLSNCCSLLPVFRTEKLFSQGVKPVLTFEPNNQRMDIKIIDITQIEWSLINIQILSIHAHTHTIPYDWTRLRLTNIRCTFFFIFYLEDDFATESS